MKTDKIRNKYLKCLGDSIRYHRERNNNSQEELAFLSNLHRTYIGSVERGERNITILNLQKIADALKVNISDLLQD